MTHPDPLPRTPGEPVTVRPAGLADLPALVPLFDAYRQFYELPSQPALAQAYLSERLQRHEALVWMAWQGEQAVGLCLCYPYFCSLLAAPVMLLNDLYTLPSARGQGVAAALMQAAEAEARQRGFARMDLSTAHGNHAAQSLYRAQGWQMDQQFRYFNKPLVPHTPEAQESTAA